MGKEGEETTDPRRLESRGRVLSVGLCKASAALKEGAGLEGGGGGGGGGEMG